MKTIAEIAILMWVVTFITHEQYTIEPARELVAMISFVASVLAYLIVFCNQSSSYSLGRQSFTGTR